MLNNNIWWCTFCLFLITGPGRNLSDFLGEIGRNGWKYRLVTKSRDGKHPLPDGLPSDSLRQET